MRSRIIAVAASAIGLSLASAAQASRCDAHYPFDGTLADATGNGYDGLMIAGDGEPGPPEFVEGKHGEALHIHGGTAMRSFLDLHYEACPQFTITAWFRLPTIAEHADVQYIFSTGASGGIPGAYVSGRTLRLSGQANGLPQQDAIRDGYTWYFVAAVFDYDARIYKLYWRNRSQEAALSESPYQPEDSFWVGTRSDTMYKTARSLYIDDLRVHGRVLELDEIRDVSANRQPTASR